MKFVLKPSLEHMTLVKIVISLWDQNDVSALISKLSLEDLYSKYTMQIWKKIEERVIKKVPKLSLPHLFQEKMLGFIKPIGLELLEWMKYHGKYDTWIDFPYYVLDVPRLPTELCWTPNGTLDRKKTAEVLVRDENLDIFTRYCLACDYCLEDDIIRFWNKLPEDLKDYYCDDFPLISFWSDNMQRGEVGHISYKDGFYRSALGDNKVAAKYFLQKLTPQEREEALEYVVECIDNADILCFLLPEVEEEQQILVFKSEPCGVLRCFLQWPFQSFFIRIANCMWDFLSKDYYDKILRDIIGKVRDGYKDYNYQKLLGEFWQKSPSALKDSLIEEIGISYLLDFVLCNKDRENIRSILKDANHAAKSKFFYSVKTRYYLTCSIRDNEWDFLQFFIRECFPSKNKMLQFKEKFEKRICPYFKEHFATKKLEWDQLFSFSDDSICEYDKRSVEEGESSSSK